MMRDSKIGFIFSPLHLLSIVNLIILATFSVPINVEILGQRNWYVATSDFPIIATGFLGTFTGLVTAQLSSKFPVFHGQYDRLALETSRASVMEKFAKVTFLVAFFGYLVWIATDFKGWSNIEDLSHLETIPGLTTLTQFMPISLATFYFLLKNKCTSKWIKVALPVGLLLSVIRSFVNHERLALLECIVPIVVVFFLTQNRDYRFRFYKFYAVSLLAIYVLFSSSEYFRSWQYYRNTIDESFFAFSFFRLINYYATALNNGVVYFDLHEQISSLPIVSANFVWNLPIFGPYFQDTLEKVQTNLTWSQVLRTTMGTDEFNNINPYFLVAGELGVVGLYFVFAILGFALARLYRKINSQKSCSIPIYACYVVGILEFPRIFWFGSGRALPTILASWYLLRKLSSRTTLSANKESDDHQ